VGIGLFELAVLPRSQGQIRHHVQAVPAPGGPPRDDGDHGLGHGADQTLHLQDVQPARAGRIDLARLLALVPVAVPAADALVAARAECPAAVLGAGAVAGEQHGRNVGTHPGMVQSAVELIHRVRAKGVADLRAVDRDPHHRQVSRGARAVHAAVVGDVGEIEPLHLAPTAGVEQLGHLGRNRIAHPPYCRPPGPSAGGLRWSTDGRFVKVTVIWPHLGYTASFRHMTVTFASAYPDRVDYTCYSIPLRTRFRGLDLREGVLIRGDAGWGEFSPFAEYGPRTSLPWLRAAREAAEGGVPAALPEHSPVDVTVPAVPPEHAHEIVTASGGCRTAKVKVAEPGQTLAEEQARLEAVRAALGPQGRIRIDANAGWDLDQARRRLPVLDRAAGGLEYAEQPCPSVADLAALRRLGQVPIAADESIRRAEDPYAVARAEAADVVVLKVQPLGGVRASLR